MKQVETGFHGLEILIIQSQGDFYYKLLMKDGKELSFVDCVTTSQYEKQTYSELVELDNQIMQC